MKGRNIKNACAAALHATSSAPVSTQCLASMIIIVSTYGVTQ